MALRIHPSQLQPETLQALLQRFIFALTTHEEINVGQKFFMGKELFEDQGGFPDDKAWIINPLEDAETGKEPTIIDAHSLTLRDVSNLISVIIAELLSQKYRTDERLGEYPSDNLQKFYNSIRDDVWGNWETARSSITLPGAVIDKQTLLIVYLKKIIAAFDILFAKDSGDEVLAVSEARHILPDWLLETKDKSPLLEPGYYKVISKVISPNEVEPGYFDQAIKEFSDVRLQKAEFFPGVQLGDGGKEALVSIVTLRKFFNEWAEKIIEEDGHNAPEKRVFTATVSSDVKIFPEAARSVGTGDKEYVQDLDALAIKTFREFLIQPWRAFLQRTKTETGATATADQEAEDGGSEAPEEDLEKIKKEPPQKPDEIEKLKDNILDHQRSVREEVLRLDVAATGFFLAFNNLPPEFELPVEVRESEAYRYFQKELFNQLLEQLNRDPTLLDDKNRREAVLHQLLFKLMANPKFQTYIQLIKEKYVSVLVEREGLSPEKAAVLKQEIFEKLAKNPSEKITDSLLAEFTQKTLVARPIKEAVLTIQNLPIFFERQQVSTSIREQILAELAKNPAADIKQVLTQFGVDVPQQALENLPNRTGIFDASKLTKGHFEVLLKDFGLSDQEQKQVFEAADLLLYMRVTPERVTKFTPNQLTEIFGEGFSKLDTPEKKQELAELLGVYLSLRRGWFEKKYDAESISQSQDTENDGDLTAIENGDLNSHRQLLKDNPKIEARHLVRAAMFTPTRLAEFASSDNEDTAVTLEAANLLKEERKKTYANFVYEMQLADTTYAQDWGNEAGGVKPIPGTALTPNQMVRLQAQLEGEYNLSHFEHQSGVVLDNSNEAISSRVIRSGAAARKATSVGQTLKVAKTALNMAVNQGAAFIGGLAIDAVLPGVSFLIPKKGKELIGKAVVAGVGLVGGGGLIGAAQLFSSIAASFGTGVATIALGAVGAVGGFIVAGPAGFAAFGGLGIFGGIILSGKMGSVGSVGSIVGAGGATPLATPAATPLGSKLVGAFRAAATSTPGVAVGSFVVVTTVGTAMVYNQMLSAFLPPPPPTYNGTAIGGNTSDAKLWITKTADKTSGVKSGDTITYTVVVRNNSADTITGILVTDTLDSAHIDPGSIKIVKGDTGDTSCSGSNFPGFSVICKLADLPTKGQTTISYSGTANSSVGADGKTPITNLAKVTGKLPDGTTVVTNQTQFAVNGNGNTVAQNSLALVNGLERGFWGDFNYHPNYPQYFSLSIWHSYTQSDPPCSTDCPNPAYPGPIQDGATLFWCTLNVIISYNEAGYSIPTSLLGVGGLANYFSSNGTYIHSPKISDIQVGDAAFFGTANYADNGHIAIVGVVTSSYIITYDSDNYKTQITYPVLADGTVGPDGPVHLTAVGRLTK